MNSTTPTTPTTPEQQAQVRLEFSPRGSSVKVRILTHPAWIAPRVHMDDPRENAPVLLTPDQLAEVSEVVQLWLKGVVIV